MELLTGTVPVNKLLLAGTVPKISYYWPEPLKSLSFTKFPNPLKVSLSAIPKVSDFLPEVEGKLVQ